MPRINKTHDLEDMKNYKLPYKPNVKNPCQYGQLEHESLGVKHVSTKVEVIMH